MRATGVNRRSPGGPPEATVYTRSRARPLFSAVLLRRWPDSAERSKAAGRGRAAPLAEAGDRLRPNSRAHDPCASRTPWFPAAGAVPRTGTGHGARTRPYRCTRPAASPPLPFQPGPAARPRPRRRGTSHPVAARGGCTKIPRARRRRARKGGTHLLGGVSQPGPYTVRPPGSAEVTPSPMAEARWVSCAGSGRLQRGALRHLPVRQVAPERDQQAAGEGDDRDPADPPALLARARPEPAARRALGLVPDPQPGQLDHGVAQARVAGLGDALLAGDLAAAPGRRRQPGVGGHLPPVGELAVEALVVEHRRDLRADPLEPLEQGDGRRLRSHLGDLPLHELEALDLA